MSTYSKSKRRITMQMDESYKALQSEDPESLQHYGIKGQKWGLRRFQNPDGSYTELGKERRRVGFKEESGKEDEKSKTNKGNTSDVKIGGKAYKDMSKRELRAAKKRARHNEKERRAKREFNRDKREAIENGDIAFISKNISKFTNDEIDESITRYKKMQDVWNLDKGNQKNADHYLDKAIHYLQKVDKLSTSLTNIYNSFTESGNKSEAKRNQKNIADQNYWKALQEKYKYEHPNSEANKKNNDNSQKDSNKDGSKDTKSEKEKYKDMKDADRKKERKEDEELKRAKEARKEREEDLNRREKEFRKREKEQRKQEKWEKKQAKKEERAREKEEEQREREREREEERRQYYEDYADDLFKRTERMRRENEDSDSESKYLMLPKFGSVKMDKDKYNQLIGSFFSKKDKNQNKDYMNSDDWKKKSKDLDDLTSKYLNNLSNYYNKNGYDDQRMKGFFSKKDKNQGKSQSNDDWKKQLQEVDDYTKKLYSNVSNTNNKNSGDGFRFKIGSTRDNKWKKQLSKNGADTNIDKWVKDMKKKYMTERHMDSKTAEKYAERYVDAWLDAYDEDLI